MSELNMTYADKAAKLVRDTRAECARAICNLCATHGEPLTNEVGLYVHRVFHSANTNTTSAVADISSTFCMAGPIWNLIHGSS